MRRSGCWSAGLLPRSNRAAPGDEAIAEVLAAVAELREQLRIAEQRKLPWYAVSGSIIIESIFNIPGVGKFFVGAIFQRDYPSVQGVVLVLSTVIVFVNQ